MIKTRYIVAMVAALSLGLSSVASARGFATWATQDGGHRYAFLGPNGLRWGRVGGEGGSQHHRITRGESGYSYGCTNCPNRPYLPYNGSSGVYYRAPYRY
jgi:hypothetical protein